MVAALSNPPQLAGRESATSWRDFLLGLKARGLCGVRMVVTDAHSGLKRAVSEVLPEAEITAEDTESLSLCHASLLSVS